MRLFGARLQLLLAALIVLLATAASDRSHYFCKMMGRAVAECCCGSEHRLQRSQAVSVRAPDCCERLAASPQPVATTVQTAALPDLPVAALIATLPAVTFPEPSFRVAPALRPPVRAPPAIELPFFISHCALLI